MTKKPQTIQETPNEEKEDDSIEAHLRQHAREIANLKGQIAENDYKTETVQRQTAYLLHKNSKREEEEEKKKKKQECLQQSLVGPRKPRLKTENSMPDGSLTSQE